MESKSVQTNGAYNHSIFLATYLELQTFIMAHRDSQFLAALEQKKLGALCVMARPRPCMLHACARIAGACMSGDPVTVLAIFLI
jgi:hypothetical protein